MPELSLIFVAGLLGSSHCIGMCGPFAIAIGSRATTWRSNVLRQVVYSFGRLFTYVTLGAIAGYGGWRLEHGLPVIRSGAAILAVVAGVVLMYQGLKSAGVLTRWQFSTTPRRIRSCQAIGNLISLGSSFRPFLTSPQHTQVFLAGLLTGLMPCGLLYGFVALAASSADLLDGALMMGAFGVGTVPVMLLSGSGGMFLGLGVRRRMFQAAAWCVVLTGLISIARGVSFVEIPGWFSGPGCPACRVEADSTK